MEEPFEFNDEIFAIALDTNHTTAKVAVVRESHKLFFESEGKI
jgi:hypothetical protein